MIFDRITNLHKQYNHLTTNKLAQKTSPIIKKHFFIRFFQDNTYICKHIDKTIKFNY